MAEQFPSELQQKVNESGFQHIFGETAITTEMDVSLPKKRRRFTKGVDQFRVTINIDYTEYNILYNFFNVTLAGGVNRFLYDHPFTGEEREFRMKEPTVTQLGGTTQRVSMDWELMP